MLGRTSETNANTSSDVCLPQSCIVRDPAADSGDSRGSTCAAPRVITPLENLTVLGSRPERDTNLGESEMDYICNRLQACINLSYLIAGDPSLKEAARSWVTHLQSEMAMFQRIMRVTGISSGTKPSEREAHRPK